MKESSEVVRFFTFAQYHNKQGTGSTKIRVDNLLPYWSEASIYKYGEKPDVLIFQKVYCTLDYDFPEKYQGIKILDICDPDWFNGQQYVKRTIDAMDAVTCPTEPLAKFIRQLTDKPVKIVRDRFIIPKPKGKHIGKAKKVVWFGYRHNFETLKPALKLIKDLGLHLVVISEENPFVNQKEYTFIKYTSDLDDIAELRKCDFAILPKGMRPQDTFKSENKTVKAILAGLPVAAYKEEVEAFMGAKERNLYMDKHYDITKKEYDVVKSVEEMKSLINDLKARL